MGFSVFVLVCFVCWVLLVDYFRLSHSFLLSASLTMGFARWRVLLLVNSIIPTELF